MLLCVAFELDVFAIDEEIALRCGVMSGVIGVGVMFRGDCAENANEPSFPRDLRLRIPTMKGIRQATRG